MYQPPFIPTFLCPPHPTPHHKKKQTNIEILNETEIKNTEKQERKIERKLYSTMDTKTHDFIIYKTISAFGYLISNPASTLDMENDDQNQLAKKL